jgi:hypothetical protein
MLCTTPLAAVGWVSHQNPALPRGSQLTFHWNSQ